MISRRKASPKSRHECLVPDGSSSQHDDVVPKVVFAEHSVDLEEDNAYEAAKEEVNPPRPGTWAPPPFHADPVDGCPSKSCPNGLAAIRSFCRIVESVEYHLPKAAEVAESSRAALRSFRVIDWSGQHVSFAAPCLDSGAGRGMTLDVDHLEGLLMPQGNSDIVQLAPRNTMAIITGFASNFHSWIKHFFFVCVNCWGKIFRSGPGDHPLPPRNENIPIRKSFHISKYGRV
uniref:Uncharacterized protein n=1 Tax=Brassica campestris TaxID=3711 RepID=M4EH08_BRACM